MFATALVGFYVFPTCLISQKATKENWIDVFGAGHRNMRYHVLCTRAKHWEHFTRTCVLLMKLQI